VWGAVLLTLALSGTAFAQGVPDNEVAQLRQFRQQFGKSFGQLYKRELHFMRMVCQPTKEQFQRIAADGEPALNSAIATFISNSRRSGQQSDPRIMIAEAVAKSVQSTLSPKQAARYQKELDQRALARKRVWVLGLVRMLDEALVLTPEQREKLQKILEKNSKDSGNQMQMLMVGGRHLPSMPEAEILPILNDKQRAIWQGIPKGNINYGFNLGPFLVDIGDEVWDEKKPPEKRVGGSGKEKTVEWK
jgi:hypothetical protein